MYYSNYEGKHEKHSKKLLLTHAPAFNLMPLWGF